MWKRWERGGPMELWQMDVVGGFLLADGTSAKALTGIDDHSRFCVSARLMPRERTQLVCDGFLAALRLHGVPQQVLTDNGKVFTGKYARPPVDVLFDRLCRENGIDHLLTQPRSPTTTGKIERFHRTLRIEFDTRRPFTSLPVAQQALDEWVTYYNTQRPQNETHQPSRVCDKSTEPPQRLFLIVDLDGARHGPSDRILYWTMRVGPPDEGGELPRRGAIPSDPHSCPRAHWAGGNRIVDA